ncbi:MAG: VCBS repeat-containing protein [Nitrospinaceae bacterium]|nr:VCBS repeat-containing protein [Nitrospinaceae bacterium]
MQKQNFLKTFLIAIILLAATTPRLTFAQSDATLDRIVSQIEALYPPLEGYVIAVEGSGLTLDLKRGMAVKKGDRLNLIRYGMELFHPVTKKKVGRKETDLGEIEILEVRKDFSYARATNPTVLAKKGDGVRSPFQKLTFLVAPPTIKTRKKIDADRLRFNLEKKLNQHPRFEVSAFDFGLWMVDEKLNETSALKSTNLKRLNRKVNADLILLPNVRTIKGKMVLSYKLVSAKDGSLQKQAQVLSDDLPAAEARREGRRGPQTSFNAKEKHFKFIDKEEFPYEVVDFDVGDLDGDGKNEYVLIDRYRVMVYKLKKGKLKKIGQMRAKKGFDHFLGVDVGDINGNGRDEIFVTNQKGIKLESFALERQRGKKGFKHVWKDVNLYFRIIRPFGEKPTLLTQSPGIEAPFMGPIKKVVFKNRRYFQGPELNTPDIHGTHFILNGLTQTDLSGNKIKDTIILDDQYHLRVYSPKGKVIVKSDEYYGRDPRLIDVGVVDDIGTGDTLGKPVRYKSRLQFVKNGSRRYLVLPKNYTAGSGLLSRLVIVSNSGLAILGVNREGFEKIFDSSKQKGYLGAFRVVPRKGNAGADVHILRTEKSIVNSAASKVPALFPPISGKQSENPLSVGQ